MKNDRPIETLEDAIYAQIHCAEMPAKAQAETLGVSYTRLVNCCHESSETAFHHSRWIIPQTLAGRRFFILDYMERMCGRVAFLLPEVEVPKDPEKYRAALMQVAFEMGEAAGALESGLKNDNTLTRKERAEARKEVFDVVNKAMALYKMLED